MMDSIFRTTTEAHDAGIREGIERMYRAGALAVSQTSLSFEKNSEALCFHGAEAASSALLRTFQALRLAAERPRHDADELKTMLAECGLTKSRFCLQTGLARTTLDRYLAGKQPVPELVRLACEALAKRK